MLFPSSPWWMSLALDYRKTDAETE